MCQTSFSARRVRAQSASPPLTRTAGLAVANEATAFWTMEKLQAYISFVKRIDPLLRPEAEIILSRYYQAGLRSFSAALMPPQMQRMADSRNQARTTIRMLESIVRIAQAHARLMCHTEVQLADAIATVTVMESSMQASITCS